MDIEKIADAIDAARFQHPQHPRQRDRPFAAADASDREYAMRLARAAISALPPHLAEAPPEEASHRPASTVASCMTLVPVVGWNIGKAVADAARVADLLGICVKIDVNGVEVLVSPGSNVDELVKDYYRRIHS